VISGRNSDKSGFRKIRSTVAGIDKDFTAKDAKIAARDFICFPQIAQIVTN